jgi:hypothetical protein
MHWLHFGGFLLVIPFFVTSSNGSKVESNFDFNCNNPIVQFVGLHGLPTYVAFVVDLLEIHVITKEEESKLPPFKKPKKYYDILGNCWDVWAIQFPWGKMLKSETR